MKYTRGSDNIFIDLGFGRVEAANLKLRSELMFSIEQVYKKSGKSRSAAARKFGLTQPRLNALLKGKLSEFNLDALVEVASRAGLKVRLVIKKAA